VSGWGTSTQHPRGRPKASAKKSDKSGRYFVIFGVVVAFVIIGALVMAWSKLN
jgi:hypothetical protein